MRSFLATSAIALGLTACAKPRPPPKNRLLQPPPPRPPKAPQCWNGDAGTFRMSAPRTISGVGVTCEKTSDGKNAQWMGKKH
jgi:hypothetical protein